jgi:MoaA/NifB/PqqE/SkfB family radical SAM enzyme
MNLSIGIGLTNDCNLSCGHCYRSTEGVHHLALDDIKAVCQNLPVASIGMGTGENSLHPQFVEIVDYLRQQGIKLTMASNGYSLNTMPEETLHAFHDVEVSIDFPDGHDHDLFRGRGNWDYVRAAMERCRGLGIEVSILATMMNTNYDKMDGMVGLARSRGANLRVNAYQAVATDRFRLSHEQFWEGYRRLFATGQIVSCTEPVVRAALHLGEAVSPCGHQSVRITPQGSVAPCVYWPDSSLRIDDVVQLGERILDTAEFKMSRQVPLVAADCRCRGGCASRRALSGQLDGHDKYCPWVRGEEIDLKAKLAPQKDLPRAKNVCTTIVM